MPAKTPNPTPVPAESKPYIKAALAKISGKQSRVAKYNDYYNGKHPFNFSSEKFTTQFADRLKSFRDNLCRLVVKAPADRLEIIGFANDQNKALYEQSWQIWKYSKMPQLAKRIHREAFKIGDAFVIVWADDAGKARIYPQDPAQCTVFYDAEDQAVEYGAKLWRGSDNFIYLTLYFRDRIEKFVTKSVQAAGAFPSKPDVFEVREVVGESFPLPNTTNVCPVFHFALEDSILADVIPLNDALNKSIADMLVSSESNSLRQRWTSGITFETNPETGMQIIPFEHAAQWFATNDPAGRFGQFPDISLKDFLEQINDFRSEIATISGIPPYYLRMHGAFPSGDALSKAESRFVALIADAQIDFGETWADVIEFALTIDGNPDPGPIAEGSTENTEIETRWKPADPMSANEAADLAIKKKTIGVSTEKLLSEIGYTAAEIDEMRKQNAASATAAGDAFGKVFNAGPGLG